MSFAIAGGAVALGAAAYKGYKGIQQTNAANKIKPVDPGYQVNQRLIDGAKTLSDQYGNYTLPGYSTMQSGINRNFQNAFDSGVQGATSGGDVLDLATKMAYGKNQVNNQLGMQAAQGKQSALGAFLNANANAGQEFQNQNAYERDMYQGKLREKAALTQAGATNTFSAADQIAGVGSKYLLNQTNTAKTAGLGGGGADPTYNKYFYPNGSPKIDVNGNPIDPYMSGGTGGTQNY